MYIKEQIACSVEGDDFCFRCVKPSDVAIAYVDSLNNEQKYLETKSSCVTLETQRQYISGVDSSKDRLIFGLFHKGELIATSGVQSTAGADFTIGIFIIDGWRGRGLGKILVWLSCALLSQALGALTVKAGMKIDNQVSLRSFLSCGFSIIETNEIHYKIVLAMSDLIKPSLLSLRNTEKSFIRGTGK